MKKYLRSILAAFMAVVLVAGWGWTAAAASQAEEITYTLSLVGDCTLGADTDIYYAGLGFIKTVGEDYAYPLQNVQQYFAQDDLTLVNLEGVLADEWQTVPEKAYNFRGPTAYAEILTLGSVEAVTLANNHTWDFGAMGYQSTVDTLEDAGIDYVETDSTCLIAVSDSFTVGLYGVMYNHLDEEEITQGIRELKEQGADYIILAAHWGYENSYVPISQQTGLAHAAIDAGANLVWGHHPHVLQPIEEYGDGLILYSMGNFCFGGNTCPDDFDSALVQQAITCSADGTVREVKTTVYPMCISSVSNVNNYQPTPYEEGSEDYARVMKKLNW